MFSSRHSLCESYITKWHNVNIRQDGGCVKGIYEEMLFESYSVANSSFAFEFFLYRLEK